MRALLITSLLFAAACTQEAPQAPAAQTQARAAETASVPNNCPARAASTWQGFAIEAASSGETCAQARATLTIRNIDGAVGYEEAFEAQHVMTLAGAESTADMERRLREWITPAGAAMDSAGDLPAWEANAERPGGGEDSAFYPAEGKDRAAYEALRRGDAPMICFIQGMESQACWLGENGVISKIGVQRFPG
jgi:hypothetical protein